ncbi:MAG: hydantoinase B/oxoprolinase family protein [Balneolaceae bacterium]
MSTIWKLRIDTGGTFTDCIGHDPHGQIKRCKVLSSGALRGTVVEMTDAKTLRINEQWHAPDNFIQDFHFSLVGASEEPPNRVTAFDTERSILRVAHPLNEGLPGRPFDVRSGMEAPVLGAHLLTGTRPGSSLPPMDLRLSTTRGTNALLERNGAQTLLLITRGFGDLLTIRDQTRPDLFSLQVERPEPLSRYILEVPERMAADGSVIEPLNLERIIPELTALEGKVDAVAICLMNSYRNPDHEKALARFLEERGFPAVSVSSDLAPAIKILPRAQTTEVNAYLSPSMSEYLDAIRHQSGLNQFSVMTSTGSLTRSDSYQPKDGLLSGPAGGVAGAAVSGRIAGYNRLITFDMGGTSTDVSRYENGFDYRQEHTVGDATLTTPALSIETVAAGGGSICGFDGKSLTVGPDSAGASPGPACYGAGGPLTITDVNLLSGRLTPSNFHIPLDIEAARDRLKELQERLRKADLLLDEDRLLNGLLEIINEKMAQAIAQVSTAKGFNPADYTLVSFGGAGGQHATEVAEKLGIQRVLLPPDSGLLSAYGLDHARLESIVIKPLLRPLETAESELAGRFQEMQKEGRGHLLEQDVPESEIVCSEQTVLARLEGQESSVELEWNQHGELHEQFREAYEQLYGHWVEGRGIEIESLRVIMAQKAELPTVSERVAHSRRASPCHKTRTLIDGEDMQFCHYRRTELDPGDLVDTPALVLDPWTTLYTGPGWNVHIRSDRTIELVRSASPLPKPATGDPDGSDPVTLQLYINRFASIAEQMGEMLRRTSLSVNVKERLDFSCALLDREGYLVVNAPHIPVHLGAMGLCVRTVLEQMEVREGDVILTNHPGFGGSHLPDMTVITPVFHEGNRIAFVASRAHHSEIGGSRPGSMPPDATRLSEEGVVFAPMKLIRNGTAHWEEVRNRLTQAQWPSRSPDENLADLQAAVAAGHHGSRLLKNLVQEFGPEPVERYMKELKRYAAERMRQTLQNMKPGLYEATEEMDDGTRLAVRCRVENGSLSIDFSGTSRVHPGNLNGNPSIVYSVIIYVLRLMINEPLPLNDGLLDPVSVQIPEGLLNPIFEQNPDDCPAVVGGNIETSQRLVDTLIKAFRLSACSQGTMNNLLFGNDRFGYYETVAGGTGAGPGFHGADGVHHHMTNTRATDPEILELRYPVRLDLFSIRKESGGNGRWKGGNGVARSITFLEPAELSLLTQHRTVPPFGLDGGEPGACGEQFVLRKSGEKRILNWNDAVCMNPGDRLVLKTPGGGGYGLSESGLQK